MESTYQMLPSDYLETQVLLFNEKGTGEWFIDENSLLAISGMEKAEFVRRMNHADYRLTRKGYWIISLIDAYLVVPQNARVWLHAEQTEHLPLRLKSGALQDSVLLSVQEALRRYHQVSSLDQSRGNYHEVTLDSIRQRIRRNLRHLEKYGLNKTNSQILREASETLKERDCDGTTTPH